MVIQIYTFLAVQLRFFLLCVVHRKAARLFSVWHLCRLVSPGRLAFECGLLARRGSDERLGPERRGCKRPDAQLGLLRLRQRSSWSACLADHLSFGLGVARAGRVIRIGLDRRRLVARSRDGREDG